MFVKSKVWNLVKMMLLITILAGCSAAPTATPTPIPTIDPKPTFEAISTQAAQTVVANLTLNAPTATPITPTATLAPTNTPAPTDTPAPTATATRVFIPWTQTPTTAPPDYNCVTTDVSPKSSDTIKVDTAFDGKWSLKNTGILPWKAENADVKYIDGTKFQTHGDLVDVNSDVAPNGTYTVLIDMKSPSGDGSYNATWGLNMGGGSICTLTMSINVTK